jgi:hypothetical protein
MVFATDWMEYHRVSLQLENLSDKPVAQVPQQDVVALEAILKVVQKHRREDMSIHATAVLFAVIGLVFVERKTRK